MKVIVTGSNGLVGSALVRQCVANDKITRVFALTRKPLPDDVAKSPKVAVILHEDFSTYPPKLLDQLAGTEGCLWAIGGRAVHFPDVETYKKVQVDYTLAAARAFLEHLAPQLPDGKQFRFVFCSGKFAEWDQTKPLHFMADTRRVKGQVEQGLCEIADADKTGRFAVYCARPSGILPPDASLPVRLAGKLYDAIDVDRLAKAFIRVLIEGYKDRIIENSTLLEL
ncbi:Nucleoside-diphosphate-sugar epimerase [Madurella fahalii]|uniref:Nucleoside-diphosphate-sugar epimerase n=1 Tax=Madurella fahalii TaxID=1157608 RepID=A0ABQ0FYZ6_9PEZI